MKKTPAPLPQHPDVKMKMMEGNPGVFKPLFPILSWDLAQSQPAPGVSPEWDLLWHNWCFLYLSASHSHWHLVAENVGTAQLSLVTAQLSLVTELIVIPVRAGEHCWNIPFHGLYLIQRGLGADYILLRSLYSHGMPCRNPGITGKRAGCHRNNYWLNFWLSLQRYCFSVSFVTEGQKCSLAVFECLDEHKTVVLGIFALLHSCTSCFLPFFVQQQGIFSTRLCVACETQSAAAPATALHKPCACAMDCCHCPVWSSKISFLTYFSGQCLEPGHQEHY